MAANSPTDYELSLKEKQIKKDAFRKRVAETITRKAKESRHG